ncbi:hypothetical protein Patl1_11989 [Pistacia atlantica]|uniref:Uncharacterized protein n=1 Tax=Pistacia atlantica TaxID=434234 RepID=A0ACC1A1M1_9ROSI|nr:hypothetical protein Patl1_11989 [Pistacia atlantica]
MDYSKDRINTLLLVSTLVITVTFATGFTVPGGYNDADPEKGMAIMLGHWVFYLFIFCDTIGLYCSAIATVILFWAQLGDPYLMVKAVDWALSFLGIALFMMILAFQAGVYLVVSKLIWLAIAILVISAMCLMILLVVFTPLVLPLWFSNPFLHRIEYYPFQLLLALSGD